MDRLFFILGCLSALIAVAAGAFGAHALRGKLTPDALNTFETGVRYQMYHALALIAVAWAITHWPNANVAFAGWLFLVGTVLFSGSLYALCLTGIQRFGIVTPVGGLLFIAGWLYLAWIVLQARGQ
jgi:uncharacterized membrane protein YgdD (TMEM256/DUF423 family)